VTLGTIDFDFIDMMTVVLIGNSNTYIKDGKVITPRGYSL
ncbi:MAG: cbiH, partial [Clostridia bacterium]|nr:cbiH [Clostridia bacterium]